MRLLWVALVLCVLAVPGWSAPARVVQVVDGDTLRVRLGEHLETIRIFGIDAPERGQPGGEEARAALMSLLDGRDMQIHRMDRGRYGRTVARVETGGRDVGEAMVRSGHAWQFTRYDESLLLRTAQDAAQREGIGLWQVDEAEAPWQWRANRFAASSKNAGSPCQPSPRCSRMTSCEEAIISMARCGPGRLDGDRDGMPCEQLCQSGS